jgi:hypothetical protein
MFLWLIQAILCVGCRNSLGNRKAELAMSINFYGRGCPPCPERMVKPCSPGRAVVSPLCASFLVSPTMNPQPIVGDGPTRNGPTRKIAGHISNLRGGRGNPREKPRPPHFLR